MAMWKRSDPPTTAIGRPTLISTDVDQAVLQNATDIPSPTPPDASRPTLARKSTGDVSKALPKLPMDSMQHIAQKRPVSPSVYTQPSLEYGGHATLETHERWSSFYPQGISPPESPDIVGDHHRMSGYSPDISPISATPSPTASHPPALSPSSSKKYSSNLPLPKNNTKKFWKLPNEAKGSEDAGNSTVRWDEYSGEPTAGDRGKPPSATPGSIKLRETPSPLRLRANLDTSIAISSNNSPARKRVGNREIAEAPIMIRPEWRGAGGRHSIVKPLFDKPLMPGQSGKFPAGSHKQWLEEQEREQKELDRIAREQEQREMERAEQGRLENEKEAVEAARQTSERAAQQQRQREREQQQRMARVRIEKAKRERERILHTQEESERRANERVERITPSAVPEPLNVPSNSASPIHTKSTFQSTPATPLDMDMNGGKQHTSQTSVSSSSTPSRLSTAIHNPRTRIGSLMSDDMRSPLARNPSTEEMKEQQDQSLTNFSHGQQPSPRPPSNMEQPLSNAIHDVRERASSLLDPSQFEARFRSNFQNMSIYEQPQSRFSATTIATTTYDNSPPQTPEMPFEVSTDTITPNSILNRRRPVAPTGVIRRKPTPFQAGTPNGVTRKNSKSLPKPPPDAEVMDPIQALQAKVDVLRRRRKNLETVIHELTTVVQPNSITYDRASRAEIKKTVAGLDKELSEVIKDEHETGLKLHRAWKRHEDFAPYEPTSIWVRRVTT